MLFRHIVKRISHIETCSLCRFANHKYKFALHAKEDTYQNGITKIQESSSLTIKLLYAQRKNDLIYSIEMPRMKSNGGISFMHWEE